MGDATMVALTICGIDWRNITKGMSSQLSKEDLLKLYTLKNLILEKKHLIEKSISRVLMAIFG